MANTRSLDLELSSSQYASITDGSQTGLDITGDITIEAWVKLESSVATMYVVSKVDTTTQGAYYFSILGTNEIRLLCTHDGDTSTVGHRSFSTSAGTVTDGVWTHIACVADISVPTIKYYFNGGSEETPAMGETASTSIYNSTASFRIGAVNSTPAGFYDGLIDEVRVWNDIRTAGEIAANYNKQLIGTETGLVGYWRFNNNYLDMTSNDNDLTASGSPVFSSDTPFGGFIPRIITI